MHATTDAERAADEPDNGPRRLPAADTVGSKAAVGLLAGTPEWLEAVTAAEQPDLWDSVRADQRFRDLWPRRRVSLDPPISDGVLPG